MRSLADEPAYDLSMHRKVKSITFELEAEPGEPSTFVLEGRYLRVDLSAENHELAPNIDGLWVAVPVVSYRLTADGIETITVKAEPLPHLYGTCPPQLRDECPACSRG